MSSLCLLEQVAQIMLGAFPFMHTENTRVESATWDMDHLCLDSVVELTVFSRIWSFCGDE